MTAVNDEGGQINLARDLSGEEATIPQTMQKYKARSEPWMLVVDDNCESDLSTVGIRIQSYGTRLTRFRRRGICS